MKKFWKVLTTLVFGVLLLSACSLPLHNGVYVSPSQCYWNGVARVCPVPRMWDYYSYFSHWGTVNRYNYFRPYYWPIYEMPLRITPRERDGNGVVTKDGYKKEPPPTPERKAKPRTGGRGQGPSDHYFEGTIFDESIPLRERMPWLWPSCDPNCGQPSQELEFRLKEFEQFQSRELERFEQFKRNERIRYIHTPIMEE